MSRLQATLFVSRESATYHFTVRQIEEACRRASDCAGVEACDVRIIHIEDDPEAAERHNIEALPTFIVGRRRFVGVPTPDFIETIKEVMEAEAKSCGDEECEGDCEDEDDDSDDNDEKDDD